MRRQQKKEYPTTNKDKETVGAPCQVRPFAFEVDAMF